MSRYDKLYGMLDVGVPGVSRIIYCAKSGSETAKYRSGGIARWDHLVNTLTGAYNAAKTGRNDVILLSPDSHSQSSAFTWAKNMTHLVGAYPSDAITSHRSRIGHSANFTPFFTISGYGNLFKGIYWMHGRGSATNTTGISITGNRNTFVNCHFGGPFNDTEASTEGYALVNVNAQEITFKNCVLGADTIDSTTTTVVKFGSDSTRVWFDNCYFLLRATGADPVFINTADGGGNRHYFFKECHFINFGTSTMTLGIKDDYAGVEGTGVKYHFTAGCSFTGVTDVCTTGRDEYIFVALSAATTTPNAMGLVGSYEYT